MKLRGLMCVVLMSGFHSPTGGVVMSTYYHSVISKSGTFPVTSTTESASSKFACAVLCQRQDRCSHFLYQKSGMQCHLFPSDITGTAGQTIFRRVSIQ